MVETLAFCMAAAGMFLGMMTFFLYVLPQVLGWTQ